MEGLEQPLFVEKVLVCSWVRGGGDASLEALPEKRAAGGLLTERRAAVAAAGFNRVSEDYAEQGQGQGKGNEGGRESEREPKKKQ